MEVVVAYFKILSQHSPGRTGRNNGTSIWVVGKLRFEPGIS